MFHSVFFGVNEGNDFMMQLTNDTEGIWTIGNSLLEFIEIFEKVSEDDSGSYLGKRFQVNTF